MSEDGGVETGKIVQTPIREVKAIERNRNEMIISRAEIKEYVEPPLVKACERLWDLNVRTLSSTANAKDVGRTAGIIIDYNSLSERNKIFAKENCELIEDYDGRPAVNIIIPVEEATTSEDLEGKSLEIVSKFQKQKATWIPSFSIQQIRQVYAIEPDDEKYGVDAFIEEGYYYDQEGKKFYLSEEHYKKAIETE